MVRLGVGAARSHRNDSGERHPTDRVAHVAGGGAHHPTDRTEHVAGGTEFRTRRFDPAIIVDRDIRTPDGMLIAAAGTRVDPLARRPLTRNLLFIDGRREPEVAWALARARPAKIVLLAGRPLDLMRAHGRAFFFDWSGGLSGRFGLRFTPTLVEQVGSELRVTEVPIGDRTVVGAGATQTQGKRP